MDARKAKLTAFFVEIIISEKGKGASVVGMTEDRVGMAEDREGQLSPGSVMGIPAM